MVRNFVDRYALGSIVLVCALVVFAVAPAKAAGPLILRAGSSEPEGGRRRPCPSVNFVNWPPS